MYQAFVDWFHLHYQLLKDFAGPFVATLGLLLTAIIAAAGFRSFGRWKREQIEERRIEVALDALAIAYEASFRFEGIRSRFVREGEYEAIDEATAGNVTFPVSRHREAQRSPFAVLKRIAGNADYFQKVSEIEPKFMAVFGSETQAFFQLLYEAAAIVQASAQALFEEGAIEHEEDQVTRERLRKLRADVFASKGKIEDGDRVGQKLLEFQREIEALCRPIVDQSFGKKRKKVKSN